MLAPNVRPFVSFTVTLLPLEITNVLKSLASFKLMSFAEPAPNVAVPLTARAPVVLIVPFAVTDRSPPKVPVASVRSVASTIVALAVPLVLSATGPVNSLPVLLRTRSPLPELKLAVPPPEAWMNGPVWVMPPVTSPAPATTVRFPVPIVPPARINAVESLIATA